MNNIYNVIVIGSGPAGRTACLYLARANLEPLALEGDMLQGGLLTTTKIVENFPGFPDGIDGYELTERLRLQSEKFGTIVKMENVVEVEKLENNLFEIKTNRNKYLSKTIIVATGSVPRHLKLEKYEKLLNNGISTCAVCDGSLPCYRNKLLAVVGGGDSACEEALHLTHTASKILLIHRQSNFRASKIMAERVKNHPKIDILWNTEIIEVNGETHLENIIVKNNVTQEHKKFDVVGLFVAIGHIPNSNFVKNIVKCDDNGYIITNKKMETNVEGIWAVGDVQDPVYRQAITAAGSGCSAALEVERWLNKH